MSNSSIRATIPPITVAPLPAHWKAPKPSALPAATACTSEGAALSLAIHFKANVADRAPTIPLGLIHDIAEPMLRIRMALNQIMLSLMAADVAVMRGLPEGDTHLAAALDATLTTGVVLTAMPGVPVPTEVVSFLPAVLQTLLTPVVLGKCPSLTDAPMDSLLDPRAFQNMSPAVVADSAEWASRLRDDWHAARTFVSDIQRQATRANIQFHMPPQISDCFSGSLPLEQILKIRAATLINIRIVLTQIPPLMTLLNVPMDCTSLLQAYGTALKVDPPVWVAGSSQDSPDDSPAVAPGASTAAAASLGQRQEPLAAPVSAESVAGNSEAQESTWQALIAGRPVTMGALVTHAPPALASRASQEWMRSRLPRS